MKAECKFIFSWVLIQLSWLVINLFPSVLESPIDDGIKDKQLTNCHNTILELLKVLETCWLFCFSTHSIFLFFFQIVFYVVNSLKMFCHLVEPPLPSSHFSCFHFALLCLNCIVQPDLKPIYPAFSFQVLRLHACATMQRDSSHWFLLPKSFWATKWSS